MHIMAQKFNSKNDSALLGQHIRAVRKSRGITLKRLAKAIHVHHSQISRIERGEAATISKNLIIICTFLNVATPPNSRSLPSQLGQRIDAITIAAPSLAPAIERLVEAMEAMIAAANKEQINY